MKLTKQHYFDHTSTRGSRRLRIVLVPLALTFALGAGMGWYIWDVYKSFKILQTRSLRIQELSDNIIYLDEVLTMSARLAAATGDQRWQERYLQFVPQIFEAFDEAQALFPALFESEEFAKTNAANNQLYELEKQAFALIEQGNAEAAASLLLSPRYEEQKAIYSQGLEEATAALEEYAENAIQEKAQRATTALSVLGTALVILLFAWIAVLRMIQRYIEAINTAGLALSENSHQIIASMEQQERTISEQAASITQTTTTMEQLGASTRQSAEQAESSAAGAHQALELAEEGNRAVAQSLEGMSTLKEQVSSIAEQIMRLSEQTGQISLVSELVGNLANQTNMLALNASVEAARAGEQGKGFSVVAGEIRKLADQSKKSSEKINTLVRDIQAYLNSTVMVTDEGTKKANLGIELARETADTFSGVVEAVNNAFLNSQQIAMTAKQQVVAVQEVLSAVSELDLAAKETASAIKQVKTSTEHLDQEAQKLKAVV
ncbi:MAG: methyl-accepting chemotaxis protein [Cyanophyceae cyanobacterium]